ncbi:MAG: transcription elongation factor GreA [Elusimicrobia bacterium CG08_land_8_20_14_0_20_59_10]|nr:MAG: transcription elongation factor GreA [Elusimicrobia bacterium CG08_land_8_20_14_0_20_59_10]
MSDVYLTKGGYEKLKEELAKLNREKSDLSVEIGEAREQGDLKENAGYIYAKEKQGLVIKRIGNIESRLRSAIIVDNMEVNHDEIRLGATVTMRDEATTATLIYTLSSADEADPGAGRISVSSPLAQGLLGATEGKTVSIKLPSGEKRLTVLKVEYK